jgi:hypothetical protein
MQLMFKTRNGVQHLDWAHYAVLRDNVQHYLESGPERASFKALHEVERAVDGEVRYLRALDLRREVQLAWGALARLRLSESAISLRTRALLMGQGVPLVRGTLNAKTQGWSLPVGGDDTRTLQDIVRPFVEALLLLTDLAAPLDDLCVMRVDAPREAKQQP